MLYVGSEEPRKNLGVLLQALSRIRRVRSDVHLLKIGRPRYPGGRARFMAEVHKWGMGDALTLIDHLPDTPEGLPAAYNAADVFLFPSLNS